jgi:adenosylcobinamide kinase / adenosylcobinamide-phosphate guanylyltransferase
MAEFAPLAASELIVGGQKSGKSRRAETLAMHWLAQSASRRVVLIATAQPGDAEMQQRIARHRRDRAERVPELHTVEEPLALAATLAAHSDAHTLVIVDCLTLWLTNWLMPASEFKKNEAFAQPGLAQAAIESIATGAAWAATPGPLIWVSNEIGLGVIPLGCETREFVDALGSLNQAVAQRCERVTLMAAGLPICLKGAA